MALFVFKLHHVANLLSVKPITLLLGFWLTLHQVTDLCNIMHDGLRVFATFEVDIVKEL